MSVDSANGSAPLVHALHASGRLAAVIIGSSVALLSLFNNTPVWVASFRGTVALGAVIAATSIGSWFTLRAWVTPPEPDTDEDKPENGEGTSFEASNTAT